MLSGEGPSRLRDSALGRPNFPDPQEAGQHFRPGMPQDMIMPPTWKPGQTVRIPDPSDPTGTRFIEIPAAALEVKQAPAFGADIVAGDALGQVRPVKGKKKKKKKKISPNPLPIDGEAAL